jgi:hypothetical protein
MFMPLKDYNPTRRPAVVVILIILLLKFFMTGKKPAVEILP